MFFALLAPKDFNYLLFQPFTMSVPDESYLRNASCALYFMIFYKSKALNEQIRGDISLSGIFVYYIYKDKNVDI